MNADLDSSEATETLKRQAQYLSSQELLKAGQRAVNRAANAARTQMARGIRQQVKIDAKTARESVEIGRARGTTAEATLTVAFKPIPLKRFAPTPIPVGVAAQVYQNRSTLYRAAFIAGSIGDHVFKREGPKVRMSKGRYEGMMRQQITKMHAPSLQPASEQAWPDAVKRAEEVLEQRMTHEIKRAIEKANR